MTRPATVVIGRRLSIYYSFCYTDCRGNDVRQSVTPQR